MCGELVLCWVLTKQDVLLNVNALRDIRDYWLVKIVWSRDQDNLIWAVV